MSIMSFTVPFRKNWHSRHVLEFQDSKQRREDPFGYKGEILLRPSWVCGGLRLEAAEERLQNCIWNIVCLKNLKYWSTVQWCCELVESESLRQTAVSVTFSLLCGWDALLENTKPLRKLLPVNRVNSKNKILTSPNSAGSKLGFLMCCWVECDRKCHLSLQKLKLRICRDPLRLNFGCVYKMCQS